MKRLTPARLPRARGSAPAYFWHGRNSRIAPPGSADAGGGQRRVGAGIVRKLIVATHLTPAGMRGSSAWTFPFWNDELARMSEDDFRTLDVLLPGWTTHEHRIGDRSTAIVNPVVAAGFSTLPTYVASAALDEAPWNNPWRLTGALAESVPQSRQEVPGATVVLGSGDLIQPLLAKQLVDEHQLLDFPLVRGPGKRVSQDGSAGPTLTLTDAGHFSTGLVRLTDQPVRVAPNPNARTGAFTVTSRLPDARESIA